MNNSINKAPNNSTSKKTGAQAALLKDLESLKQRRKQLTVKKGNLSREIGNCKKSGESFERLIAKMKTISVEIKQLDTRQKEIKNRLCSARTDANKSSSDSVHLPLHIHKRHKPTSTEVDIVTVQQTNGNKWQKRWDHFVNQQSNACVYHHYEFKSVIEQTFGHDTIYLLALDNGDEIQGVLPAVHTRSWLFGNYITTMPFFNYGGPLATNPDIEDSLVQALVREAEKRGVEYIELRETQHRENYPARTEKYSLFLQLPKNPEILWSKFSSKLRTQIKKGQGNPFEFKTGGIDLLDDFYRVFSINMRDLGTPVYAKSFFQSLLNQAGLSSTLAILYYQSQPVSCAFLLGYNDVMEIPWASTLRRANPLNANMVLYWNVIRFAIVSGFKFFDFGRSSKDASTYKFKQQWGAQPVPLYWHYWIPDGGGMPQLNPGNPKFRLLVKAWQKLPVSVANLLGPYIVRNLP